MLNITNFSILNKLFKHNICLCNIKIKYWFVVFLLLIINPHYFMFITLNIKKCFKTNKVLKLSN